MGDEWGTLGKAVINFPWPMKATRFQHVVVHEIHGIKCLVALIKAAQELRKFSEVHTSVGTTHSYSDISSAMIGR